MKERDYNVQCANAEQAATLKLDEWFGKAARDGNRPNELIISLTEQQAAGLDRDFGIIATPMPLSP
ncbi:MAG TPA: hypothetical protein VL625_06420 [Patescibacteria group bacterium]|nr:hypothetical protein [Patescibacteria group bacterium]